MIQKIDGNWRKNYALLTDYFRKNSDIVFRQFRIGHKQAFLVQISGLVDKAMVAQAVISRLSDFSGTVTEEDILNTVAVPNVTITHSFETAVDRVLERQTVLFVDGITAAFTMDVSAAAQRSIEEPASDVVVRGPHVGFIENLTVNLSLIYRYLRNPNLRIENFTLGTENKVQCVLLYLDGIAHFGIVALVKERISKIHVDNVLGCGYIEQLIEDAPQTVFPTIRHTERPDVTVAGLLEGRVAILTDGCPTSLIIPSLFLDNFHSTEDYHSRRFYSSLMRILRFLAFLLATQLTAMYVAIENFHKELVPSNLLISVAGSREGVPFPLPLEVLLMLFAFELIKEAGLRMPKSISSSVSIVGGLILGQAAVDSGFIGIPTVIIVAVAGMSGFLTGGLTQSVSLVRVVSIIPASFVGLYGLLLYDLFLLLTAASIKSFGVPYLAPLVPTYFADWKDTLVRGSIEQLNTSNKEHRHNIGRYFEESD